MPCLIGFFVKKRDLKKNRLDFITYFNTNETHG